MFTKFLNPAFASPPFVRPRLAMFADSLPKFWGYTSTKQEKFTSKNTLAVVLNLEKEGPFANTISLFSDGVRVSTPQALPVALRGKVLYPTVTFKNVICVGTRGANF